MKVQLKEILAAIQKTDCRTLSMKTTLKKKENLPSPTIRFQMKYIGHTIFNDERYGGEKILKGTTFTKYKQFVDNCFKILPRQALHARTLGFVHPVTNEFMRFEAPIPQDIEECLEKWRHYSQHVIE